MHPRADRIYPAAAAEAAFADFVVTTLRRAGADALVASGGISESVKARHAGGTVHSADTSRHVSALADNNRRL